MPKIKLESKEQIMDELSKYAVSKYAIYAGISKQSAYETLNRYKQTGAVSDKNLARIINFLLNRGDYEISDEFKFENVHFTFLVSDIMPLLGKITELYSKEMSQDQLYELIAVYNILVDKGFSREQSAKSVVTLLL